MTLVELLVVIGIIGILAGLLLGAAYKVRAYAKDRTWRLQAFSFYDYIQEHSSKYYQSQTNYAALSADELHARGVFDDRIMDFFELSAHPIHSVFI